MGSRGETRITGVTGHVVAQPHRRRARDRRRALAQAERAEQPRHHQARRRADRRSTPIGGELATRRHRRARSRSRRATPSSSSTTAKMLKPPLRFNSTGGEIRVDGLRTEARLDGRNSEMDVTLAAPAPVTIYNIGEDIRVTRAAGRLHARRRRDRRADHRRGLQRSRRRRARAPTRARRGPIRGGGPTLTLRVDARKHRRPEACGQITKSVTVCSSQYRVTVRVRRYNRGLRTH